MFFEYLKFIKHKLFQKREIRVSMDNTPFFWSERPPRMPVKVWLGCRSNAHCLRAAQVLLHFLNYWSNCQPQNLELDYRHEYIS